MPVKVTCYLILPLRYVGSMSYLNIVCNKKTVEGRRLLGQ